MAPPSANRSRTSRPRSAGCSRNVRVGCRGFTPHDCETHCKHKLGVRKHDLVKLEVIQSLKRARCADGDRGIRGLEGPAVDADPPWHPTCPGNRWGHLSQNLAGTREIRREHADMVERG
jgi:hypothetical protein